MDPQALADLHKKQHRDVIMDPKHYEKDYMLTNDADVKFMRSPFYEFAKQSQLRPEEADQMFDDIAIKMSYMQSITNLLRNNKATKEERAYTRYADMSQDQDPEDYERTKHVF